MQENLIRLDDNAKKALDEIKSELKNNGIGSPNYSETIRFLIASRKVNL